MFRRFFYQKLHRILLGAPIIFLLFLTQNSPSSRGNFIAIENSETAFVSTSGTLTVTVTLDVKNSINAVGGVIHYPNSLLVVDKIEKDNSVIDLWVEEPFIIQERGDIVFEGGMTNDSGYHGSGTLLKITFLPKKSGVGKITLRDGEILSRDGAGTPLLFDVIDAPFHIREKNLPTPDINGDGDLTLGDVNTLYLATFRTYNPRYDLNGDGKVNWGDVVYFLELSDNKKSFE